MKDNYAAIVQNNIGTLFAKPGAAANLEARLPGAADGDGVSFSAFGEPCRISPAGIFLSGVKQTGPVGIVISLYALGADSRPMVMAPFKAFKDFPGSMPYVGAFAAYTQEPLVPHVEAVREHLPRILETMGGSTDVGPVGGDLAFRVMPLPKIALCYIFYEADEDFPASVTCIFSSNAVDFIPMDGLADTGEYTTRRILRLLG
ncbi:DUF3786 domain-containing protein [Desulfococcus sp.]|uniref:DUF3786 domain-containing protein n=1 Tax=Desulfococcus sp. TaxID=2025834 RepID=UPI003594571B